MKHKPIALNRPFSLIFISIIFSGIIFGAIGIVQAEQQAMLSTPEFTVKLIDHSYDVPPTTTTTIDQYTGKETTTTISGRHVENKTIEITIKNQPIPIEALGNQSDAGLYYTVRVKGHYGNEWREQSVSAIRPGDSYSIVPIEYQTTKIQASGSTYTVLTYIKGQSGWPMNNGDEIDIQVQAYVGYLKFFWNNDHIFPIYNGNSFIASETSDWSNIQTITILDSGFTIATTTPNVTPAATIQPTQPPTPSASIAIPLPSASNVQTTVNGHNLSIGWTEICLFIAVGIIVVLAAIIIVMHRKSTAKQSIT